MTQPSVKCMLAVCVLFLGSALPAGAQYRPLPSSGSGPSSSSVKGETYHVELGVNLWGPAPNFIFSSENFGIPGTKIDVQADLAIARKQMYEIRLVLRPGTKHKFRLHYLPMAYTGLTQLKTELIFNGIRFPVSAQVATDLQWKTYRFAYEYDFIYRAKGYMGVLLEAKYTDAVVQLTTPVSKEYVRAQAPIPAIGAVGRYYVVPFISVTGEFTYFKLPNSAAQDFQAHYFEFDIYGTVNFTNNFGAQVGWRKLDLGFQVKKDQGQALLTGPYFGGVARF